MAGALLGADRSVSNWQLLLEGGGILLTEDTAAKTLVEGLSEKETEAGITLSIDPSTAYATIFAPMDKNFCTKFDQAIAELAPNFLDSNDEPFAGDLEVLANLVGDEQVVTYQSDGSPLADYSVAISSAYITQRLAMLNLFVTPAMDIYSMPCIVKSAKVILPTEAYAEDQTGTWASQDVTVATMSNDVVTVVSDGACSFTFTGSNPTNSGSITAYCLLEPDVNVVKNCAAAKNYSSTDTTYGVTIQMSNQGVLTLNGTMTQNAEFTVSPLATNSNVQIPTYFDCSDIEGNLLLWCEELGGSCTVSSGRVYIDFCSKHPSSSNITVSEYQLELYNTLQIAQHTHAKLIHNDTKNIYGIRIFASSGTVFNNYQIRIGIKKYPTNGQVYNFGLLEPYMLAPNTFAQYMGNGPHTRVCDGSFSIFGLNTAAAVYRYSHSYTSTNFGPATIVTGDHITEIGKAYRFTVQIVEKPENTTTIFKNAPAYFNLYYSDGAIAATINLTSEDQFHNDIASTSFISEKVVDFLGLATIIGATMQGRFRVAFNLEEISIDDLDLENLTLYTDSKIVNQQDIKVVYEPAAIIGSPTASALTWSSSNDEIATVDENGHITIHSDGECTFTATSVKTPSISASVTAMCYYAQDDNMVANLVKISQKTYSQGGITVKHNADGTITFNGTTTNKDTSYYRNVIWPLGNSKTVWNVFFPRQGISGTWLLWWEYVSGSIEGTSTFTGGSVSHELYVINHNGTEILKIQAKYTSPDDTDREKYCKSMTNTDGIRLVSWGFQMKKGTKFNNYTVRVGIKKFANLDYHGGVLEEFLCALTGYKKFDANKNTIWTRFPDGSIGGYLDESITAFPSASGYVRLTKELSYANNVNSILTGDSIGIAGHNYKLNVNLIKFKYDRIAATELKFGVAYANGTPAGEITIIDPATFVSSGTNIDLSGTTYSTVFQATEQLDCAYQYFNQLKVKGKEEYFAISLSDLDTMIIAYGQVITITGNDTIPDDITVNYGGRLNVSSGVALPKVTENGGYVYISDATVTFAPNTITDLEITGKNSATLHSGTVLESSIINGNSAFVDVSSGGSCVDTTITSGGRMYVYNNGIASNIEVNEGSFFVNAVAGASDITLNSGATLIVSNYGTISNVTINPDACTYAYGPNVHCYNVVENGGYLDIPDNQDPIESMISPNHVSGVSTNKYTAHSGTTLTDITGNSGYVYNSGIVNSTTLRYRDELVVSSGGTALNVIEDGGALWDKDGAVYTIASNTITGPIGSGCWNGVTVHSNTIVSDATIVDDELDVYPGGIVSNTILDSDAYLYLGPGGTANNISAVHSGCYIEISSGGYASNVRLSSGALIEVSSGGTALDVENVPFLGLVFSHAGASVTCTSNLTGVYYGNVGQIASHADSLYTESIYSRYEVYSGGVINVGNLRQGGYLQVNSGGTVISIGFADNYRGKIDVLDGGIINTANINSGYLYVYDGGYASNVAVTTSNGTDRAVVISSGGTLAGSIGIGNNAKILLRSGAIVNYDLQGITPAASARINCSGLFDTDASPVFNAIVTSNNVNGNYKLAIPASTFEQYPVNVYKDGISAGIITLEDSLIANDKEFSLSVSGNTLMLTQTTYIPPISETVINAGETLTVLPYEKYFDTTINGGTMFVSSEGKASSVVVNRGGKLLISSGAIVSSIVENGGNVVVSNGGIATFESNTISGITLTSLASGYDNETTIHSGNTAIDVIVDHDATLNIRNSGIASNVTVNEGGRMLIAESATATNIVENGGYVSAHSNAIVSYVPNVFTSKTVANCTMHSGTTGTDLFCIWGDMYIFSGGLGSNVSISHGGIIVYGTAISVGLSAWAGVNVGEGGTISNITAKTNCTYVNVYSGGYASNIDLSLDHNSWGHFTVSSGGIIDGIIRTNQVSGINVISGGIINFNLTNQTPDNAPLLSPLSSVHGEPTYTLTMPDEELSAGIYNLADGLTSEGFHDYIHLQDTSRIELDHVAVGVDYASASARYALDVIDDTSLVLSKGEWDLIIDSNSKVTISNSYGNVLVRLGDLSCGNGTTIDNLQVLYGGYVNGGGAGTVISNCAEHGGNIEPNVASKIQHFTPNYISDLQMISGKNIQLHSGTTLFGITGVNSNYIRVFSGASVVNPVVQNFREFTVNPGGVIINPTVPQGNAFAISSGGTALHVSVAYIERITITNGAYIEWINEEGNLIVVSSGVSNVDTDMTSAIYLVTQSGTLNATSGAILSNVSTFGTNNVVNVLSNAFASHIDLNRGTATISQGVVDSITLYSGVINMADGATVSKIGDSNYNNNGLVNISSGAIYDGGNSCVGKYNTVTVYSGGSFVNASGIALSIDGKSGCYISHVMPQVGRIRVTVAPNTYINAYYTYGWRTMENAYFSGHVLSNVGGGLDSVTILSGGSAEDITMTDGAITVSAGGILTYPIMSGGTLTVMSGGSAIDIDSQGGVVDSRAGATVLYLNYTYISSGGVTIVTEPTDSRYQVEGVLHVKENGVVSGNKVYGTLVVSSGGIASDTELIAGGLVISGGEATGVSAVCVSSPGVIHNFGINVRNGGILNDTTASGGYLYISSGGTMNSASLYSNASATIYPDGLANDTYLVGGNVYVSSGGIVNNTVVSSGGYLYVSSGGTALNISRTPTEGRVVSQVGAYVTYATDILFTGVYYGSNGTLLSHTDSMASKTLGSTVVMEVFDSGIATNTNVSKGGSAYINSNGILSNTTLNAGGDIFISNGGVANNTTINSGGYFYVYSGGTATGINAKAGAALKLTIASDTCVAGTYAGSAIEFRNGSGSNFKLTQWDYLDVLEGCVVDNITVENLCSMSVDNGGVASNVTVSGRQVFLYVNSGGTASNVNASGDLHVNAGGVVYNTTVCTWSTGIHTGGIASTITVINGGYLVVSEGAVATDIIENGGYVGIVSGATATFASHVFSGVLSSGSATVHSNTVASNITISSGYLHVLSSGIADNVIVNAKGGIFISSGGIATNIRENGGYVSADENANVTFASTLTSGLVLSSGVRMTVHELTTATDITLSAGNLYVYSNGICSNVMVNAGMLDVSSGGTAVNVDYPPTGTGMIISRTGAYITYTSQYSGVLYTSGDSQYIVDSLSNMTVAWSTVGTICAMDNGVVENVSMTGGRLFTRSGGVVSNASVSISNDAAYLYGYAYGLFESVSMTNNLMGYCCMTLYPLASASNVVVGECTRLIVSSGATATDIVEDGGYVEIADGASVTFTSHVIDHTTSNMSIVTIHSNTTLSGADLIPTPGWPISCHMTGGTILDATLKIDYAVLTSGYLSNVTFSGAPYRLMLNGNVASNVAILGGNLYLNGGSFTSVRIATWTMASENVHMDHVKCEAYLQLANGTINGLDIDSACTARITSSIVSNVNIYTGAMLCQPGCTIDSVTIHDHGELHISANASVTNIVVSSNGTLYVASDGSALNVTSNAGAIISADEGAVVEFNV